MDWVLAHKLELMGGTAFALGLGWLWSWRSRKRAHTIDVWLVSEERLVEFTCLIRKRYSVLFFKRQTQWRAQRRSLQLGSDDYFKFVRKCHNSLNALLRQATDQVLKEAECAWTVYDDSVKMYRSEPSVNEAVIEMRLPLSHGPVPHGLTLEVLQEILSYYSQRLQGSSPAGDSAPLLNCLIEDEIQLRFGVEIEEVERGFDKQWERLTEFDFLMQSIRESRMIEEVPVATLCM